MREYALFKKSITKKEILMKKNILKTFTIASSFLLLQSANAGLTLASSGPLKVDFGGDFEYSLQDSDSMTTTEVDADINIKPSIATDSGLTFSADLNFDEEGESDGGNSLAISGNFGKLNFGDVNSATDKIDDATDWGYVLTEGSPSTDHAFIFSMTPFSGATIHISGAADENHGTSAGEGYGYSAEYAIGDIAEVGYGKLENSDDSSESVINVSGSVGPVDLAYEIHTDTAISGVDTDTTTMSTSYDIGGTMFALETMESEVFGETTGDKLIYGVHHELTSGVTLFGEFSEDKKDSSKDALAIGIAMSF